MLSKIDVRIPYEPGGQLGADYNRIMDQTPYQWVLFLDHDLFLANPHWYVLLQRAIQQYPSAGIFTCWTNNLGNTPQRHPKAPATDSIAEHRAFARAIFDKFKFQCTPIGKCSGMLMCVNKDAWALAGGFPGEGLFKEDWTFARRITKAHFPIYRVDGLYVYHLRDRRDGSWIDGELTSKELRDQRYQEKKG